ncbi:esterase-like activity of phytase family protein [Calothrix sp. 336/3]|uniref:esterase-like activity of phytase family protein n=1 Tax=Calothrix sp. 336/3 TaxID=1337936 RepID=UPI0004E37147|nr:esterase-like activity of phytase family protein [Calothrix sp. 336/3]AKG24299.1 hypothetical protein IJ00_25940 [Calothrix sp. 336/3]
MRQKRNYLTKIFYILVPLIITIIVFNSIPTPALEITGIDFIGSAVLPKNLSFQNTIVGGLSGITYDAKNDLYYAISDDRSQKSPARFYTLKINLTQGKLQNKDVSIVGVTTLLNEQNKTFSPGTIDTEGIALTDKSTVYISSEGDVASQVNPFIKEFALATGKEIRNLPIPEKFLPDQDGKKGVRNNLVFESLTVTPDNRTLFTATENALVQDGAEAKPGTSSPSRVLQYNLLTNQPEKEFLYPTEAVKPLINLQNRYTTGIPDLLALDNQGHFLSIERAFTGLGFYIALFQVDFSNATDISSIESLLTTDRKDIKPVQKKLLLDLRTLDVLLDNTEGLTLGAKLPDGGRSLILVSDNNFNNLQRTQILAFKLKTENPLIRLLRRLSPQR